MAQRVLWVVHEMNRGGIETLLMNIYRVVDREKIMFDFVVHVEKECFYDEEIYKLGGKIFHCPEYRIVNQVSYVNWWKRFLQEHPEYQIVHSHYFNIAKVHLKVAKELGRTTIVHSHISSKGHGWKALARSILIKDIAKVCDYKFACSKDAAKYLFGEKIEDVIIFNNSIDVERFRFSSQKRGDWRKEFHADKDTFIIGNVARMEEQKNHFKLLEIFKEVLNMQPNSLLVLIGTGSRYALLKQKAEDLGISRRVLFMGERADVNDILNAFDAFVLPSLYEGLGIVYVEAQANGLPCVMSKYVVPEEADMKCGLVTRVDLSSSGAVWAKQCLNAGKRLDEDKATEAVKEAGYDIYTSVDWLTEFYLRLNK